MILTDLILDLLFPPRCLLCGSVLRAGEVDLCQCCREQTAQRPDITRRFPGIDSAHAVWYYEGSVRDSLLRYKFSGKRGYASGYGRILALSLLGKTAGAEVITWVPVSNKRKRQRGYDQA
jgi:predicted amidophosphoribosyltransferase